MKKSSRLPFSLAMGVTALSMAGCATFRPMPTHAGGKRFDEEQRVLTATVYHAAGKMDFSRFKKRKIALEVTSLETSGATQTAVFPGMVHTIPIPVSEYFNVDYRLTSKLNVKSVITRQDVEYLKGVLEKRLHFDGYQVTSPEEADIYLVVLVDSLGTNYNRDDYLIVYKDNIEISCELTFYAVDAHTQKMIVPAAAVASSGNYCEINYRPLPFRSHGRDVADFTATVVPLPVSLQHSFSEDIGLAPVSDIQPELHGQKDKKKKKKKGGRRRNQKSRSNEPLPDPSQDQPPGGGLLPDLMDPNDNSFTLEEQEKLKTLNKDATQHELIQTLTHRAKKRIEGNDLEGAKKVIKQLRKADPEAPALKDLEQRLKAAEGGSPDTSQEKTPGEKDAAKSPDQPMPPAPEEKKAPKKEQAPKNDLTDEQKKANTIKFANKRLESGDLEGAKKVIQRLRKIDPEAAELSELEKRLQEAEAKSSE